MRRIKNKPGAVRLAVHRTIEKCYIDFFKKCRYSLRIHIPAFEAVTKFIIEPATAIEGKATKRANTHIQQTIKHILMIWTQCGQICGFMLFFVGTNSFKMFILNEAYNYKTPLRSLQSYSAIWLESCQTFISVLTFVQSDFHLILLQVGLYTHAWFWPESLTFLHVSVHRNIAVCNNVIRLQLCLW